MPVQVILSRQFQVRCGILEPTKIDQAQRSQTEQVSS